MDLIHVMLSVTTLDPDLARVMEPRTSAPAKRLEAIEQLAKAGVPVGVNVAPIIPGLTDEEIPAILAAAASSGAQSAGYILLRLPGAVEQLFLDWLHRILPERSGKILSRIRDARGGSLSDSRFGSRLRGEGEIARAIGALFNIHTRKHQLTSRWSGLSTAHFRRRGQMEIFPPATPPGRRRTP